MSSYAPEWLIYPGIKTLVARLAHIASIASWGSVLSIPLVWLPLPLEIVLALCELNLTFLLLYGVCLGLLLPWCHLALLPQSGAVLTRLLSVAAAFVSLLTLVCFGYTLVCREPLLVNQGNAPLLIGLFVLLTVGMNFFDTRLLSRVQRGCLVLLPLLYILAYTASSSHAMLAALVLCPLLLLVSYSLLRGLRRLAPRIVSLPEAEAAEEGDAAGKSK